MAGNKDFAITIQKQKACHYREKVVRVWICENMRQKHMHSKTDKCWY